MRELDDLGRVLGTRKSRCVPKQIFSNPPGTPIFELTNDARHYIEVNSYADRLGGRTHAIGGKTLR